MSEVEIEQNYFNYGTFGSGCCNYITLVNPNKFNYNDSAYLQNVSYSAKLFYDVHNRGINHNISLYNLTNVTSNDIDDEYYNFLYDRCLYKAFNVEDYVTENINISIDWVVHPLNATDENNCSKLVELGVY